MGYWEQIGESNLRERTRRSRMAPGERRIRDALGTTAAVTISIMLWGIMLAPVIAPFFR